MTTRWTLGMVLLAVVAVLAPGATVQAAPEEGMRAPAEMSNLKWFDGNWTCDGTIVPGPMGPDPVSFDSALACFLAWRASRRETPASPPPSLRRRRLTSRKRISSRMTPPTMA